MTLRVYDSPAARLDAEQSVPQGKFDDGNDRIADYRCFASCGAVSVEVLAEETGEDLVAWANDAIVRSQSGLEQIFGGCPAWDDVGVATSEVSS